MQASERRPTTDWWTRNGFVVLADGVLDLQARCVYRESARPLTAAATTLLSTLAAQLGAVVPRDEVLEALGYVRGTRTRALDMLMRRVREIIEVDPSDPRHLVTVPRRGLRLDGATLRTDPRTTGRAEAVRAVLAGLADGDRLVTVTGPGGIGKTTLLAHVRPALERRGAVDHADLGACRTVDDALETVGRAVGVLGSVGRRPLASRIASRLRSRRSWLVLDGAEDVVWDLAAPLEDWLPLTRGIVVASRELSGLPGETAVRLGPLPEDHMRRLVASTMDEADPAGVAAIVARASGNPLAAVIGAGGRAEGDARGLESVFASSWDRLDADGRAALAGACVFHGGLTPAAANAVMELPSGIRPSVVLDDLVGRSLLTARDGRYAMHAIVRTHASARLVGEERARLEARHAAWFAREGIQRRRAAGTREVAVSRRWLVAERHNLITASEGPDPAAAAGALLALESVISAVAGAEPWLARGDALIARLATATRTEPAPPARRRQGATPTSPPHVERLADLRIARARLLALSGDLVRARAELDDAVRWPIPLGARARHLQTASMLAILKGEPARAVALCREALGVARRAGNRAVEATALAALGSRLIDADEVDEAREQLELAALRSRQLGRPSGDVHRALSRVAQAQFRWHDCMAELNRAAEVYAALDNPLFEALSLKALAHIEFALGDFDGSAAHLERSTAPLERTGLAVVTTDLWMSRAWTDLQRGDLTAARQALAVSQACAPPRRPPVLSGFLDLVAGMLALEDGRPSAARQAWTASDAAFAASPRPELRVLPLAELATLRWIGGDAPGALTDFATAIAIGDPAKEPRANANVLVRAAWCAHQAGATAQPWLAPAAAILATTPSASVAAAWRRVAAAVGHPLDAVAPPADPDAPSRLQRLLDRVDLPTPRR